MYIVIKLYKSIFHQKFFPVQHYQFIRFFKRTSATDLKT